MTTEYSIELNNVCKTFKIQYRNSNYLFKKKSYEENKVLKNINLKIKKGEVVGILGRNGCGKSTLLSIIANIMDPDSGEVKLNGKVASILELGMGFHPDLSGRENIYLKSELYGFDKKEIDLKIDRIIEYSGISKFIDNPIRTYSSGMTGRLAFSILINVDADIILVDEVLSTGDAAFSAKASQHFKKISKSGKTVIFVSHSISAIENMCSRAIWIENGSIKLDDNVKKVCAQYTNSISESPEIVEDLAESGVPDAQYKLSLWYRDGTNGYIKDTSRYTDLLKDSADQGYTAAQIEYADYLISQNVPPLRELAIEYYQAAANKGDTIAKQKVSKILIDNCSNEKNLLTPIFKIKTNSTNPTSIYRCADFWSKSAVTQNDKINAFTLFKKSADMGNQDAMYQTALMYRDGQGTKRDINQMIQYLEKSSKMGHIQSILALADVFNKGIITCRNEKRAFNLYLKGANLGNAYCMYQVAYMYQGGEGTEINFDEAKKWYYAYSQSIHTIHYQWALEFLNEEYNPFEKITEINSALVKFGNNTAIESILYSSTFRKIPEDTIERTLRMLINQAKCGNISANRSLGNMYYNGVVVKQDYQKSLDWYTKASELGDSWSSNKIGEIYRDGIHGRIDNNSARSYFKKAAHKGNVFATINLINIDYELKNKEFLTEDVQILKNMCAKGNPTACRTMGDYYYAGKVLPRDFVISAQWYRNAAEMGDSLARNRIATMYHEGKGVDKSDEMAIKYMTLNCYIKPEWDYQLIQIYDEKHIKKYEDIVRICIYWINKKNNKFIEPLISHICDMKIDEEIANLVNWTILYNNLNSKAFYRVFDALWGAGTDSYYQKTIGLVINNKVLSSDHNMEVRIGRAYRDGKGVTKNLKTSLVWLKKGNTNQNPWIKYEIFDVLWEINDAESDAELVHLLTQYAKKEDPGAMGRLGRAYRDGRGVIKDINQAKLWLEKAAKLKLEWAKYELRELANIK